MSDEAALRRFSEELDKLLEGATTQEERNKVWAVIFEHIHEVYDDEEWANFIKPFRVEVAKRNAH
jgi:hypothetical protein